MSKKLSKSCSVTEAGLDRISRLPDNLIDRILSYLPIKDAGKTSLLSRKWRHKWETVPCLVLNDKSLPVYYNEDGFSMINKLVRDIDSILVLHSGRICKFGLSYMVKFPIHTIDQWILHVSRHPITEFTLNLPMHPTKRVDIYKMLSCFFSLENLTHLDLENCLLKPPSTFPGFKGLKSLRLESVCLKQDVFDTLISSSVLVKLSLGNIYGVDQFIINAPNLVCFDFKGLSSNSKKRSAYQLIVYAPNLQCFGFDGLSENLFLLKTPSLVEFSISYIGRQKQYPSNYENLLKLVADIPRIERLTISYSSSEAAGDIPRTFPKPCLNLRYMSIIINFTNLKWTSTLRCLLRSAPNLRELEIHCCREWTEDLSNDIWEVDQWNCPIVHLRHVKIHDFGGIQAEIDFVSFMLLTSHVLEKITVSLGSQGVHSDKKKLEMMKRLLRLKRVSPQAEIIFNYL